MDDAANAGETGDIRAIGPILASVGRELTELAATAVHMQDVLSPMVMPGLLTNPDAIIGLQEMDRLTQTLQALSVVVLKLSHAADEAWAVDHEPVLASVPLAGLVRKLGATATSDAGR